MKKSQALLFTICLLVLSSCAQTGLQIGTHVSLCCPGNYSECTAYDVQVVNMPLFLRDYIVAEFDNAFQEKGLQRNAGNSDLRVVLRYNHVNLNPQQEEIDPFVRIESMNLELNYIAQIEIEMYETSSNRQIWAGSISRIHQVVPGEYMHEQLARPEFQAAFRTVLLSYPPLGEDES